MARATRRQSLAGARHRAHIRRQVPGAVMLREIPTGELWASGAGPLIAPDSAWGKAVRTPGQTRAPIQSRLPAAGCAHRMTRVRGVQRRGISGSHGDPLVRLTGPSRPLDAMTARPDRGDPFHSAPTETLAASHAGGARNEGFAEPARRRVSDPDTLAPGVPGVGLYGATRQVRA